MVFTDERLAAIRQWLRDDEVISHSQVIGRAWNLRDPDQVDDLVEFLDRAVRGINAVLEGGLSSAPGREGVQRVEVSEVREDVQEPGTSVRSDVRSEQVPQRASGDEARPRRTVDRCACPSVWG